MSRLSIFRGDELLAEHVLMRAVVGLGRHPENDIVLDDRTLSRFHARVERRGDRYVVIDLGAQNGVHLNGQRIHGESDLVPGDRIGLGRYVAIFDAPNASPNKLRSRSVGLDPIAEATKNERPVDPPPSEPGERTDNVDLEADDIDVDVDFDPPKPRPASDDGNPFEDSTTSVESKPAQPTFVLLYNGLEVSRHKVGDTELVVGRSKQCDIVISLLGLSRKHARIFHGEEGIMLEDLGSQNGTWVNNQRISGARRLRHGDLLNFYDYGLLFLEDGDVQVGFPGAGFAVQVDPKEADVLSQRETHQGKPPVSDMTKPLRATQRAPVPLVEAASASPEPRRASPADEISGLDGPVDLDLGEGSYLGDEFEEKSEGFSRSLLDEEPEEAPHSKDAASTALLEDPGIDDIPDVSVPGKSEAGADAFAGAADDFELERTGPDDFEDEKTSASMEPSAVRKAAPRDPWPRDEELMEAMSNAVDGSLVTLEVSLDGVPYTQMPLSQTVTRVGTDPRCEFSLPKSSGLRPWHLTLVHLGSHVVCYRTSPKAQVLLGISPVDKAILRDGDELYLGKRVKIVCRQR